MGPMPGGEPWGEFEHDPRSPAHEGLRASDRDREVVRRLLGDAYAAGRLDRGELDERLDATSSAVTLGDLPPLVADLVPAAPAAPAGSTVVPSTDEERTRRAVERFEKERREALWTFVSASTVCWVIWFALGWGELADAFPWPLFVMLGTALNAARVQFQKQDIIRGEVRRQEKKERQRLEKERQRGEQRRELEGPDA